MYVVCTFPLDLNDNIVIIAKISMSVVLTSVIAVITTARTTILKTTGAAMLLRPAIHLSRNARIHVTSMMQGESPRHGDCRTSTIINWKDTMVDDAVRLCIDRYNALGKTGKPTENQWTVLSGVILKNIADELVVVSLATGTKCLGASELADTAYEVGSRLADSHAEILARRGFLRYLYRQVDSLLEGSGSEVFTTNSRGEIETKRNVSFGFYCSQTPCGDCSIVAEDEGNRSAKMRRIDETIRPAVGDLCRTGAKCLPAEEKQDSRLPGPGYQAIGPLRTKPGRGDPTLSLSCSDKIAKWNAIGVQGALLSVLIPLIRFDAIIVGSGGPPFSMSAMKRGLHERFDGVLRVPNVLRSKLSFVHAKSYARTQPCPASIVWCAVHDRQLEVAVEGRRLGATKKRRKGSALLVSRRELFRTFLRIVEKRASPDALPRHPKKILYRECKRWSESYQGMWRELKSTSFRNWPAKPPCLQAFSL